MRTHEQSCDRSTGGAPSKPQWKTLTYLSPVVRELVWFVSISRHRVPMTEASRTALIIGGGIGGLTAALCLTDRGWNVQLFEQAAAFNEILEGYEKKVAN